MSTTRPSVAREARMSVRGRRAVLAALAVLAVSHAALAQPDAADLSEGEIRKVDKENRKLTIKHGPLKNLDMPGMTMIFTVQDEAVLDTLQPGDRVRFLAEKADGKFTVTRIEAAR